MKNKDTVKERFEKKFVIKSYKDAARKGYILSTDPDNYSKHPFKEFIWDKKSPNELWSFILQIRKEDKERIIDYQHGFVRNDGHEEPERAPEWQVIEDLLNQLEKE